MNDCWVRDTGPVYLNGGRGGVHFRFNAWGGADGGGCYPDYRADAEVGATLLAAAGLPRTAGALTLEGGALSADGDGTALTTASCVLAPNRRAGGPAAPPTTAAAVEATLMPGVGKRKS